MSKEAVSLTQSEKEAILKALEEYKKTPQSAHEFYACTQALTHNLQKRGEKK